MDFYRAREYDSKYIKYEESFVHNTALIASDKDKVIGVLEYSLLNMEEAKIICFNIYEACEEIIVFKGLVDELIYWSPYLKRILYNNEKDLIHQNSLLYSGFTMDTNWIFTINNSIEVFKIDIEEIIPEQLTVDSIKLDKASSWIRTPEDIVVCCVKIDGKIVCLDGYSRLVAAYNKGFNHVYVYIELDNDSIEFYRTCLEWCREQSVLSIKDLSNRVVTPIEHEKIWINRCQAYLKEHVTV